MRVTFAGSARLATTSATTQPMRHLSYALARAGRLSAPSLVLAISAACSSSSPSATPGGPRDAGHESAHADATARDATKVEHDASGDAGEDAAINPASWDQTYPRPTETAAAAARAACQYKRGDLPAETLGPGTLLDTQLPIEHVIVLIQENHSFDTYLGHLATYEATNGIVSGPDGKIESASDDTTNPDVPASLADGGVTTGAHPYQHAPQLCEFDTSHSWAGSHVDLDNGLLDGFYYVNNGGQDTGESTTGVDGGLLTGDRALWWYDQRDIPFHYSLYSTFAMADHYHCALLGPTWPNRMYAYSATSFGEIDNTFPDLTAYPYPTEPAVVFDELEERNVSWNLYTEGSPGAGVVLGLSIVPRYHRNPTATVTQFLAQAKAGTLPAVSFVDGDNLNEGPEGDDEHPPGQIQIGQHFVWEIVNAVTTGPAWKTSALFITYDEGGGLYDHVVPPSACAPDDTPPNFTDDPSDQRVGGNFTQYGSRVPFVVVSPYAKKSYVSHTVYSHTSITRFIEAKWKVPALSARDANADPFTDMFDWDDPPFMTPPVFPEPAIDQAAVSQCVAEFGDAG
jgi:phospholipase C